MIRLLIYILLLAVLAYGGMLLVQNPGHVTLSWHNEVIDAPAALLIAAIALGAVIVWSLFRFVFGLPSFLRLAGRQRRREKGYAALSRGLIAVGSGDGLTAGRAASQAGRHLKNDPLAIMLRAQAAHMNNEPRTASAAFEELAQRDDTRVLGLRGLHADALRRGDEDAARHFADAAHQVAPLPWSAQAVLEHRASNGNWEQALATVESSLAARLIDKETGERQRAVLETAIAYDKEQAAPDAALALARAAMKRAPDLAPAIVLVARLLTRRGDIGKASKVIEKAWPQCQHPDIAQAYLDVRPGDSTKDRLTRAKTLMAIASLDPVGRLTVARTAMANKDFATARSAMAPLISEGKHPTARQCMLMAELEEAEHGDTGLWREWLARASRAPLDPAWIADGTVYDHWAPASPTTGKLDAFRWQVPAERVGLAVDAMPLPQRREPALASPAPQLAHIDAEPAAAQDVSAPVDPVSAETSDKPAADHASSGEAPAGETVMPPATQAVAQVVSSNIKAVPAEAAGPELPAAVAPSPAVETKAPEAAPVAPPASTMSVSDPAAASTPAAVPGSAESLDGAHSSTSETDEPLPRITLPPEIVAAQRKSEATRPLFHRRMTAESEARAERIDKARSANGSGGVARSEDKAAANPHDTTAPSEVTPPSPV